MTKFIEHSIMNRFQNVQVLAKDAGLYAMQWFKTKKKLKIEKLDMMIIVC